VTKVYALLDPFLLLAVLESFTTELFGLFYEGSGIDSASKIVLALF
jgi:hypothetical protein